MSVVLPDTTNIPEEIDNLFTRYGFYFLINNVTLSSLIDPEFISLFVKTGIQIWF